MKNKTIYQLLLSLAFSHFVVALAQSPASPLSTKIYTQYPSLNPAYAISIDVGVYGSPIYTAIQKELAADPNWDCSKKEFYKAVVVDKNQTVLRTLTISRVSLQGHYPTCDKLGHPAVIDLVLDSSVSTTDLLQVFIYDGATPPKQLFASDGKLSFTTSNIPSFTATPQAAPGEALNNGATRTVGQLSVAFSNTDFFHHTGSGPVNLYAKSTDLLSTDGKDSKSAVAFTGGIQRLLFPSWYSPFHVEETIQGNQTAKNLSVVTSAGLLMDPKWLETVHVSNNSFILAPLPPEPSITAQYTRRINQLVTKKTPLLSVNDFSLNPSFSWDTISFPFTCRLLFWQRPTGKNAPSPANDTKTAASVTAPQNSNCLGTEIDLGLWYLPFDLTSANTQKVEGYGDVSILVPLSDFSVASKELTYVTKTDPTKFQVRIKYSDSVNAASSYARTKGWTFGIEALK